MLMLLALLIASPPFISANDENLKPTSPEIVSAAPEEIVKLLLIAASPVSMRTA